MDIREIILKEHSKANCTFIVNWVGNNQYRFDKLFDLFIKDEYRVMQRAAWPLSYAVQNHPVLIRKHFGNLLKNLQKPGLPNAVKRNTFRLLQSVNIPKKYQGEVMNLCFENINSPTEKIAVKAFSLTILERLAMLYPEIKQEVKTIIKDRLEFESPAFRARAKKIQL